MNIRKIKDLLLQVEKLLSDFNQQAWAKEIQKAHSTFITDPAAGRREILGLYGGLGSLTDLVLYADGAPLINENNKLHDLFEELFRELHLP